MRSEGNGLAAGAPYLKPTVVQSIRSFLDATGIVSSPWDGAREILDRLVSCIGARIGEPDFRKRLERLLAGIVEGSGSLPATEAEILRAAEVSAVVADIERALQPSGAAAGHGLLERLQAPALCCLLLVAMTAGCDARKAEGPDVPFEVNGKSVLDYVQRTNLPDEMKARLSERLREMASPERKALIDLFRNKPPEEIVAHLERMARAEEEKNEIHRPVVPYKGVSFPARCA